MTRREKEARREEIMGIAYSLAADAIEMLLGELEWKEEEDLERIASLNYLEKEDLEEENLQKILEKLEKGEEGIEWEKIRDIAGSIFDTCDAPFDDHKFESIEELAALLLLFPFLDLEGDGYCSKKEEREAKKLLETIEL